MAPGRATKRRSHAAANDAVLHDVSLRMLATQGLDRFSFSDLAREAGLTRAPIYARYDSPEDVAVDLWRTTLEPELARLLRLSTEWFGSDDDEPSTELLVAITAPSLASGALMEAMAVARRYPSLQDIVQVSLDDHLAAFVASQDAPRAVALAQVSVVLGSVYLAPFVGPTSPDGWKRSLPMLRELSRDRAAWDAPSITVPCIELPIVEPPSGDELLDDFLPAITRVIARVGYEHATANRISREAGRAFNLLYDRYESKEALMQQMVSDWVGNGVRLALTPFVGISAEEYVLRSVTMGRSLVADANRPFRNLRNEMTLAARHHDAIGRDAAAQYLSAAVAGRALFEQHYDGVTDATMHTVGLVGSLVRSNGFGLCLLAACTSSLVDVDWTPASTGLQHLLWSHLFDRLTARAG